MKKLVFRIKDNDLIIKERVKLSNEYKNIINTNVISCNELIFSDEYLINNTKIVAQFLMELTSSYNIDTIIIEKLEFTSIILKLIKNDKNITNLIIKEDSCITFSICEDIVKTYIKNVSCYNIQPFMIEYLDKYNVLLESRNEILYLSNFMLENNLSIFSSLFYKMSLNIDLPMSLQDEEDFITFCKINKYLKIINVNKVNKNDLENIVDILRKNNKKNIRIVIHDNTSSEEVINYLKEFNKKKKKKYKISFKLEYSDDYIGNNLLKQTNNSILKVCGYIIILIITFTFGYVFYDNYSSMKKTEEITTTITEYIDSTDATAIISELNEGKSEDEKQVVNEKLASLYNINPDTVAWLNVPNTNIDYAVVQTIDNSYYLKHNFYMESDNNGWVFMDYRDNLTDLSDNIIIYAHNRYYNGIMFGTLQNTLRYSWYTNEDNQIITLSTLYEELHYQVFSIYKIATTNDYMQILFASSEDKVNLFNKLKDRSIYDFGIELDSSDKILTLSTCADDSHRYVLHAVLIDE